ncbi:MAG: hypothetical protein M1834_008900 [Cirrosporium novae-zelandiae]|nr:MAG: hypothetical protein M1834_008900 [Cirrosporium novae-zelandiae]
MKFQRLTALGLGASASFASAQDCVAGSQSAATVTVTNQVTLTVTAEATPVTSQVAVVAAASGSAGFASSSACVQETFYVTEVVDKTITVTGESEATSAAASVAVSSAAPVATSAAYSSYVAPASSAVASSYVAPESSAVVSSYVAAVSSAVASSYVAPASSAVYTSAAAVAASSAYSSVYVAPSSTFSSVYVAASSSVSVAQAAVSTSAVAASSVVAASSAVVASSATSAAASSVSSSDSSSLVALSDSVSGEATFYGGNVEGGACSFSTYTLPSNLYGTALSSSNWDTSANCGACIEVTGPDGDNITAMIVDECPECGSNHLDLFQDAFAELADISEGIIDVTWKYVECPITGVITLHNKEGTSEYWFSMQVVNANEPVATLEVSTDSGSTWQNTTRTDYNFFENDSGFGTDTVDVRVTSSEGNVVKVSDVGVSSGTSYKASSNF